MIGEIHHVPGRLRVRTCDLKRNPERARATRNVLEQQRGIRSVEVNAVTGSLLVYYDPVILDCESVLAAIRGKAMLRIEGQRTPTRAATEFEQRIAQELVWWGIEKLVMALL